MSRRSPSHQAARLGRALATGLLVASTALMPVPARAQFTGPLVPPSLPSSPQPLFPKLPTLPKPAPAPEGPPPATRPSPTPGSSTGVLARTQRVTVTAIERAPEGVVLRARDEAGSDLRFDVASYTTVRSADASRAAITDLDPEGPVEVTWFPQGDRRTLLAIRKLR